MLPGSAFLPASDDPSLPPEFELVLHHPERAGTVPVRAGGAGTSAAAAARAQGLGVPVERAQMQVEELRQFKALCDRLLPGLRTHSHLCAADARSTPHTSPSVRAPHTHIIFWAHLTTRYTLIHLCDRTHSVTLSEHGEVIGGATFRLIQATNAPVLLLEVLLLAVEQRTGVCGRGHGTRIVNYLKALLLLAAQRRGAAAAIVTQSDSQAGPGGGAARQFWVRQELRATPQAMLLTKALHQWDRANEVYASAVPMLCWLEVPRHEIPTALCETRASERAQQVRRTHEYSILHSFSPSTRKHPEAPASTRKHPQAPPSTRKHPQAPASTR